MTKISETKTNKELQMKNIHTLKQIALIKEALEQLELDLPQVTIPDSKEELSYREGYNLISDIYEKLDDLELVTKEC